MDDKEKYIRLLKNLNNIKNKIDKSNQDLDSFIKENQNTVLADGKMLNDGDIINLKKRGNNTLANLKDVVIPMIRNKI